MKTTIRTMVIAALASIALLGVAALAGADAPETPIPGDGGGMAMCAPDVPNCVDVIVEEPGGTGGRVAGTCVVGNPDCNDMGLGTEPICVEPSDGADSDTPVSSNCADTPSDSGTGGVAQIVEPTPGMADVLARPFDTATVGDDDRTVTIDFVSGVEPCSVLDHVDVAYGDDAVTITLFEGHDPAAGDVACIEIGVFKQVVVTLDEALAGRTIVDGAAA